MRQIIYPFGLLLLISCTPTPEVAVIKPQRMELRASFTEPAQTYLPRTEIITMPMPGKISRIPLQAGDPVKIGQTLAHIDATLLEQDVTEAKAALALLQQQIVVHDFNLIEKHLAIELQATVKAAYETLNAADAQVKARQLRQQRTQTTLQRLQKLSKKQSISQQQLDDAVLAAETARIELTEQHFYRSAMRILYTAIKLGPQYIEEWLARKKLQRVEYQHQLTQANAKLIKAQYQLNQAQITSPITGIVLQRHHQGNATLNAGHALLTLGDLTQLQVIAEVLTQDALQLHTGTEVWLQLAHQTQPLKASVYRIEPAGFSKHSALGVEQQRVNVIVKFMKPMPNLGVNYRVHAQFFTGIEKNALTIPRFSVLQAPDQSYYVFKIKNQQLQRQTIKIGLKNDFYLQVIQGLAATDTIVKTPDTTLKNNARVHILQ